MRPDKSGEYAMWLLIIVTLMAGSDGGASSSVTTLRFSTEGTCVAAPGRLRMQARWAAAPMQLKRAVSSPSNPLPLQFRDGAASASFWPFRQQECYGTSLTETGHGSLRRLH